MSTIWDHVLAAVSGVGLPLLGILQHRALGDAEPRTFSSRDKLVTYWANGVQLAILAGLTILVWRLGDRSLRELGLTAVPDERGTGLLLAGLFLCAYAADLVHRLRPSQLESTRERWRRDTPFMPATPREVAHSLTMVISAAVSEEIVFRGFLIRYLFSWTGTSAPGLIVAVLLPALVFGCLHLYQGSRAAFLIVLMSGLFGAIFVVTGSLWIPIALHFLVDGIGVLLGPRLMRQEL